MIKKIKIIIVRKEIKEALKKMLKIVLEKVIEV